MAGLLPHDLSDGARLRLARMPWRPRNCVWELTLACNLRCEHCGSRAGRPRPNELSTDEALDVAAQLAGLGAELVTLSGGEPLLRDDWDLVAGSLGRMGVAVNMVTNGTLVDRDVARRARACGMTNMGVSLDGTQALHDVLRGPGAWARATRGIGCLREAGVSVAVLTTVNRLNLPVLADIRQMAIELGASLWRLQLGKPMGSMSDRDDLVLRPRDVATLIPALARMKREGGLALAVGDSIGYYGPHDKVLRGWGWRGRRERWQGCQAGLQAIGIESDGGIKGCLSLQARCGDVDPFREGSVRDASLAELWAREDIFDYNRGFTPDRLTGRCRSCSKADDCRGGARCVAAAVTGDVTEDPYCWMAVAPPQAHQTGRAMMAAGVAAAMVLGSSGCVDSDPIAGSDVAADSGRDVADARDRDVPIALDADVPLWDPGLVPDPGFDGNDPGGMDANLDMIPSDAHQSDPGPSDTAQGDPGSDVDAMECADVCCMCDYGVIPDDVYQECCVKACENVCCECDYGAPPPPQCC